jgi:hypothetical protein
VFSLQTAMVPAAWRASCRVIYHWIQRSESE